MKDATASSERSKWKAAIDRELKALADHDTWTLVPMPGNVLVLYCKFVWRKKYNADGKLYSYKAPLVICGVQDSYDWEDTFASVVDITFFRFCSPFQLRRIGKSTNSTSATRFCRASWIARCDM